MQFKQPILLWGALAIIIPILIHFWHQKRGKVVEWAATQWLTEKNQQQHRGLRLENLPLLILRCLLVLLLVFLLSKPVLHWLNGKPAGRKIHLVQSNARLTDNYRFELEKALTNREKVYWITPEPQIVSSLTSLPNQQALSPRLLQASINQLREQANLTPADTLQLYLVNTALYRYIPAIFVPIPFQFHTLIDSTSQPAQPYLLTADNRTVFVNANGQLTTSATRPARTRFADQAVHTGPIAVLLDYQNQIEQQTVEAALRALTDVYDIQIAIDTRSQPNKTYQWVLTDRSVSKPIPQTLYVVSSNRQTESTAAVHTGKNVWYTDEVLTAQTAELVASGRLPEWLGELLVQQFGLQPQGFPLSQTEWTGLFVQTNSIRQRAQTGGESTPEQAYGLLLFIVLAGIERWLALKKNV